MWNNPDTGKSGWLLDKLEGKPINGVNELVPDGTGGYSEALTTLVSRAPAAVEQATAATLERLGANTISPMATHLVTLRYLPGVTTKTEAIFHDDGVDRALAITGVYDFQARHRVLQLACVERMAT